MYAIFFVLLRLMVLLEKTRGLLKLLKLQLDFFLRLMLSTTTAKQNAPCEVYYSVRLFFVDLHRGWN